MIVDVRVGSETIITRTGINVGKKMTKAMQQLHRLNEHCHKIKKNEELDCNAYNHQINDLKEYITTTNK